MDSNTGRSRNGIYIYRLQTNLRKLCFHRCLSVHRGRACMVGVWMAGWHAWQGACTAWSHASQGHMHGRERVAGGMCGRLGDMCGRLGGMCGRLGGKCGRLGGMCGRLGGIKRNVYRISRKIQATLRHCYSQRFVTILFWCQLNYTLYVVFKGRTVSMIIAGFLEISRDFSWFNTRRVYCRFSHTCRCM